jgi:hypothetical protein
VAVTCGLRTAQSAYNDAQWMQRCSATEQGSNAGFEKCVLYGVRHPCRAAVIKAVHAFLHTACDWQMHGSCLARLATAIMPLMQLTQVCKHERLVSVNPI